MLSVFYIYKPPAPFASTHHINHNLECGEYFWPCEIAGAAIFSTWRITMAEPFLLSG